MKGNVSSSNTNVNRRI